MESKWTPNRHNHLTRDIKPLGQCPSCDRYHYKQKAKGGKETKVKKPRKKQIYPELWWDEIEACPCVFWPSRMLINLIPVEHFGLGKNYLCFASARDSQNSYKFIMELK